MNVFYELFVFLKNPTLEKDIESNFFDRVLKFILLLILCFVISFSLSIVMTILFQSGLIENEYHAFDELKELPGYQILIMAAVIAPIMEELLFRAPLVLFKSPLKLYIKPIPFSDKKIELPEIEIQALKNPKVFRYIFYVFALAFGYIHLFNYQVDLQILLFSPILVAPQIVLGLIFGFVRIRFGLPWTILMHGVYNGFLVSLFLIAKDVIQ